MKIVLALAIAVVLSMAMTPLALADSGATVYVSVSVDGELLVAAQPVTVTDMTVEAVIKAAHAAYYPDGESGYVAGIDPTFNMYLISRCWGVPATPFVIVNGAPLGADLSIPATVDAAPVAANDNVIICTSSDMMNNPAQPVSLTSTLSGDAATVTATLWTLDFMTFMYSSAPFTSANVLDPTTGESLGTTDANGSITVTVPESGIVAVDGLAAINVKTAPAPAPAAAATTPTPTDGAIPYTDARNYIGQTVTIEAQVYEKTDAGDMWVLYLGGPSTDPNTVGIEVNKADVSKFPDDLYVGKTIRITGELHSNPIGGASFTLTDPSQVQESGTSSTAPAPAPAAPAADDTPLFYGPTISLIIWAVIILTPILVVVIVKMVRQSRLDKETVHIATAVSPSAALGSTPAGPALGPIAPGPAPSGPAPASAPPMSAPAPPALSPTAPAPARAPASTGPANVYVSVSVDGKLLVAAQPVTVTDTTVQGAIKAAHAAYYSGGEKGYKAGTDPTFNMFLITKCWGIQATPYVIVNGAPLGANPAVPATVDIAPVAANDNIIICTSSDMMSRPAQPVSLTATLSGDAATVTATAWTLDFSTFSYTSAPLANANVVDPATGASLGYTDDQGSITVTVPESGIVAIEGLAAIAAAPGKRQ